MRDHARHGFAFALGYTRGRSRTDRARRCRRRRRREQVHSVAREMNEIVRRYDTPTFCAPDRLSARLSARALERNYVSRNNSMRVRERTGAGLRIRFPVYMYIECPSG